MSASDESSTDESLVTSSSLYFQESSEQVEEENEVELTAKKVKNANETYNSHYGLHPTTTQLEVRSWYLIDWGNSAYVNSALAILFPVYITALAKEMADSDELVYFGSIEMNYASFYNYCVSASKVLQILIFLFFGTMADHGPMRKHMFIVFTILSNLFLFVFIFYWDPSTWWLAGITFILSNACFGTSLIFYNAFMPHLVAAHPEMRYFEETNDTLSEKKLKTLEGRFKVIRAKKAGLMRRSQGKNKNNGVEKETRDALEVKEEDIEVTREDLEENILQSMSKNGFVYGYYGGGLHLVILLAVFFIFGSDEMFAYRSNFVNTAIWFLGFSIPSFIFLHQRPGPELPPGHNYITSAASQMWGTLKKIKHLPQAILFLTGYLFYSDGINTVLSAAAILATDELGVPSWMMALIVIETQIAALLGIKFYSFFMFHPRWGHHFTARRVMVVNLLILSCIPIYAVIYLENQWEMFLLAFFYGLNIGEVQALSRSLFSQLIPIQYTGEFFSFYELSDKGTSWLGPLILGLVTQATGSIRWGLFTILGFFLSGLILFLIVREEKGKADAQAFRLHSSESDEAIEVEVDAQT